MTKECLGKKIRNFFKAACDHHREAILDIVKKHKRISAGDIVHQMELSQPTVSHHLKILAEAEVLHAEKQGKTVYYTINEDGILDCCSHFMGKYCKK